MASEGDVVDVESVLDWVEGLSFSARVSRVMKGRFARVMLDILADVGVVKLGVRGRG